MFGLTGVHGININVHCFAVGVHPKDMAATSDCTRIVVANEGPVAINPSSNTLSDPEGSVTIIVRNDQGFPVEVNIGLFQLNDRFVHWCSAMKTCLSYSWTLLSFLLKLTWDLLFSKQSCWLHYQWRSICFPWRSRRWHHQHFLSGSRTRISSHQQWR